MLHRLAATSFSLVLLATVPTSAQTNQPPPPDMPGMDMHSPQMSMPQKAPATSMNMMTPPTTLIEAELRHTNSGTSIEPPSTPVSMLMHNYRGWMLMLHGSAFITDTQQSGPRGADKFFSTNWIMPMAMRQLGPNGRYGQLTLRTMFSLEPATVSARQYPELFQQGETAFGKPIIDGQHPHDFFMEVAALYDIHLGERTLLSFYAAPVGDPAIGPVAYPHRLSASEDPLAALGHHQQDSTHIAFNVLTGGLTWRWLRFEESGFHGAEPTEQRWGFQPSPNGLAIDSYSSRITFSPTQNWAANTPSPTSSAPKPSTPAKTSSARPHPSCTTAPSALTTTPPACPAWTCRLQPPATGPPRSSGAAQNPSPTDSIENSYLLESLLQFHTRNYVWTRIENAGRSNELLLPPGSPLPPNFTETPSATSPPTPSATTATSASSPTSSPPPARNSPPTPHPHLSSPPTATIHGESQPSSGSASQ